MATLAARCGFQLGLTSLFVAAVCAQEVQKQAVRERARREKRLADLRKLKLKHKK